MKHFRDKHNGYVVESENKESALILINAERKRREDAVALLESVQEVKKQRCYRCGGSGEVADVYRKYEGSNIISCMMCNGNGHIWETVK